MKMGKQINFTFAFQPIIEVSSRTVYSYEALIRGLNNEIAHSVLSQVPSNEMLQFDCQARNVAIKLAARLNIKSYINLNFFPSSLTHPQHIKDAIEAFQQVHLDPLQLIIEITEAEVIHNPFSFIRNINQFRGKGIKVAIDDFGASYSGLNLLMNFQPDIIKLDMLLVRNIESHGPRQAIVKAIVQVCENLGIDIIAEGVETQAEYSWLRQQGIDLFQGYFFSRPGFEHLPDVYYPEG